LRQRNNIQQFDFVFHQHTLAKQVFGNLPQPVSRN
jgi:hypothetical protein